MTNSSMQLILRATGVGAVRPCIVYVYRSMCWYLSDACALLGRDLEDGGPTRVSSTLIK